MGIPTVDISGSVGRVVYKTITYIRKRHSVWEWGRTLLVVVLPCPLYIQGSQPCATESDISTIDTHPRIASGGTGYTIR